MWSADDVHPEGQDHDASTRRLGLLSAVALEVGEVIGVGIFLKLSEMAKSLVSPFWILVVWGAMGLITVCNALSFGSLAARYSVDSGGYVYVRRAFGPRAAFLYSWMSPLVTDPSLTALRATWLLRHAGLLVALSPVGTKLVAVGAISSMVAVDVAGLKIGAGILRGLSALKLGLLAVISVWGFGFGPGSWLNFLPLVDRPAGSGPLAPALVGGLIAAFSLWGFWDLSKISGQVCDLSRTMSRAMMAGVSAAIMAYVLVRAVFWYLVPWSRVDPERDFAAQLGGALVGATWGRVFAGSVVISVLGGLAGLLMASPRAYFAMARDGLLPSALAAIHSRLDTPARATAVQAVVASVLVASGRFEQILSDVMAVTVAFLALVTATVYVLPAATGPGRALGQPITPLGFLIPVALVVLLQVASDPVRSDGVFRIVAFGLSAYEVVLRRGAPPGVEDSVGRRPPSPRSRVSRDP